MSASASDDTNTFYEKIGHTLAGYDHHLASYIDDLNQIKKPRERYYTRGDLPALRPYIETQRQFLEFAFTQRGSQLTRSVAYVAYYGELYFRLGALLELTLVRERQKIQKWKRAGNDYAINIKMYRDEVDGYSNKILTAFQDCGISIAGIAKEQNFIAEHALVVGTVQKRLNIEANLELWGDITSEVLSREKRPSKSRAALEQALNRTNELYDLLNELNVPSVFTKGFNAKPFKAAV